MAKKLPRTANTFLRTFKEGAEKLKSIAPAAMTPRSPTNAVAPRAAPPRKADFDCAAGVPLNEQVNVAYWVVAAGSYELWIQASVCGAAADVGFNFGNSPFQPAFDKAMGPLPSPTWPDRFRNGVPLPMVIGSRQSHSAYVRVSPVNVPPAGHRLFVIEVRQNGAPVGSPLTYYVAPGQAAVLRIGVQAP